MLVLTRKIGESVVIHDDIYCTVEKYDGNEVKLIFDAPRSVPLHRYEIQRRIDRAKNNNSSIQEIAKSTESVVDRLIRKFKNN